MRLDTVLLTGATGFVGTRVGPHLEAAGFSVRRATRHPETAAKSHPDAEWVEFDVSRGETIVSALRGVRSAVYLVHGMAGGPGYEQRDRTAALAFRRAAADAALERIVYLGGAAPSGRPSRHLRSRLATGEILRTGKVPVFELRASMIIGRGSVSWQIVRDLAARLPAMLLPKWLGTRSQPIGIDDVAHGIVAALELPIEAAGVHDLPGPEVLTAKEILLRIAALRGTRPITFDVPILSPRLSSYWLKFVTGGRLPSSTRARRRTLERSHRLGSTALGEGSRSSPRVVRRSRAARSGRRADRVFARQDGRTGRGEDLASRRAVALGLAVQQLDQVQCGGSTLKLRVAALSPSLQGRGTLKGPGPS
jgi:uncharacterized protein YbjT (DUF2867 family)